MAKRQSRWLTEIASGLAIPTNSNVSQQLTSSMTDEFRKGATIVRMIGCFTFRASTVDILYSVMYGIVLTSESVGNAPEADVQLNQPGWLFWGCRSIIQNNLSELTPINLVEFDIRSQRKFRGEDDVLTVRFDQSTSSGSNLFVDVAVRTLVLRA